MRSIVSLLLLLTLSLNAYQERFSASADLLYWKPTFCPYDIAQTAATFAHPKSISGRAAFGTRATLGYAQSCFSTQLSYLWFESYQHPHLGNFLSSTNNISTFLSFGFRYQNVDWRLARQLPFCTPATLCLFANARWVDISQILHFQFNDLTTMTQITGGILSSLQGGALGLGISGEAPLFCCLRLTGLLNPMMVLAQQSPGTSAVGGTMSTNLVQQNSRFSLSPALDLQLALKYTWNCGCLKTAWSVGYELNYYWHAYVFRPLDNSAACRDLGFAGPFVSGKLLF